MCVWYFTVKISSCFVFTAFSSKSGPEDEVNIEAYKSEEVINSCKWITDQLEPTKQGSNSGSLKGSIKQRKTSLTGL